MKKRFLQKLSHHSHVFNGFYSFLSKLKRKKQKKYDDVTFFKKRYKEYTNKELDLDNPKTLNEKMLWLQIYDHNPIYTLLTDKYLVKEWVSNKIGKEHVVPLIGVWDNPDDIPFDELPEEYVLKCNHDCGSVFIKRKGQKIHKKKLIKTFTKALKQNYYDVGRVWGYKNIVPKVFCEEYIKSIDSDLPKDYKFFCSYGKPIFLFVASDRGKNTKFDFYDMKWERIPVKQHYPNSSSDIPKPKEFEQMVNIASILSEDLPLVRVDLYIDKNGLVLFGEMTFCHFSGKEPFDPENYDLIFGELFNFPLVKHL
jgi:hypothetical protein